MHDDHDYRIRDHYIASSRRQREMTTGLFLSLFLLSSVASVAIGLLLG